MLYTVLPEYTTTWSHFTVLNFHENAVCDYKATPNFSDHELEKNYHLYLGKYGSLSYCQSLHEPYMN